MRMSNSRIGNLFIWLAVGIVVVIVIVGIIWVVQIDRGADAEDVIDRISSGRFAEAGTLYEKLSSEQRETLHRQLAEKLPAAGFKLWAFASATKAIDDHVVADTFRGGFGEAISAAMDVTTPAQRDWAKLVPIMLRRLDEQPFSNSEVRAAIWMALSDDVSSGAGAPPDLVRELALRSLRKPNQVEHFYVVKAINHMFDIQVNVERIRQAGGATLEYRVRGKSYSLTELRSLIEAASPSNGQASRKSANDRARPKGMQREHETRNEGGQLDELRWGPAPPGASK